MCLTFLIGFGWVNAETAEIETEQVHVIIL